ncbi:hypothetical protein [Nocardiopsis sp. MG754419]|uniref:hypothetical protein n=1 Tax=Nocardiopsis sp. MG754419 TaxID=2259865 RepID=UPI001BA8DEB5|nr:hypothetical protein [Nocardiopsis sp. MG754419]MBR8744859.1 hypothetical protein [Nocardiopsis sp. MG754419]
MTSENGGPGDSPRPGPNRDNLWGPLACAVAAAVLAPVLALCLLMVPALFAFAGVSRGLGEVWPLALAVTAIAFLLLWGYSRLLRFLGEGSPWRVALVSLVVGVVLGMVYRPGSLGYTDWTQIPTVLWAFLVVWLRLTGRVRMRRVSPSEAA